MTSSTPIAIFLQSLRDRNQETRSDMAKNLGITNAFLSAVENGMKSAPESWVKKLKASYKLTDEEINTFNICNMKSRPQSRIYWNRYSSKEKDILVPIIYYIHDMEDKDLRTLLEIADKYSKFNQ